MKKITILFSIILFSLSYAQVHWMTLADALAAQQKLPKKIVIDFYADWCKACKTMEKNTFNQPDIANYLNENYYAVQFNSESNEEVKLFGQVFTNPDFTAGRSRNPLHEFTRYMNVTAVPSIVFLDEQAQPITLLQGALTAKELEPYVTFIATEDFKKITSREQWQNYQKKFKSRIKN